MLSTAATTNERNGAYLNVGARIVNATLSHMRSHWMFDRLHPLLHTQDGACLEANHSE